MAKNTPADFDTTAANNTDVASVNMAEGMPPSLVNNGIRALMAIIKKWWNDLGGQVTVGGTANAITITSSSPNTYQALVSGIRIMFKPIADNSGATTLTPDGLTSKAVRKISGGTDVALTGGELLNGQRAEVVYDSTANAAAGAWILLNSAALQIAGGQTVTGGFSFTPLNGGTISSGTVTPNPASQNYQYYTNNGAHTLAAPSSDCAIDILITNGASAGAITFSGFTVASGNTGDALTTTNTNKFVVSIRRINGTSTYVIKALQ